jgi:hypothetical protein
MLVCTAAAVLKVRLHACIAGDFHSSWAASGGHDQVAEALFGEFSANGCFS